MKGKKHTVVVNMVGAIGIGYFSLKVNGTTINCIDCMFDEDNIEKFTNWYKKLNK